MNHVQKGGVIESMVISNMILRGDSLGYLECVIVRAWDVVLLSV